MQQQVSESLKRLNYTAGQLLTAESLHSEQEYFLARQRRHNRWLHVAGTVSGLELSLDSASRQVTIRPGCALDCAGNELIVESPSTFDLDMRESMLFLALQHHQQPVEPSPRPAGDADEPLVYNKIEEYTLAKLYSRDPQPHALVPGQPGATCGEPHPLVIAVLVRTDRGWQLRSREGAAGRDG